jgi:hypothetical protein
MLKERESKLDYQFCTSEVFDLQLKRVSRFYDKNFAHKILVAAYQRADIDTTCGDILYEARVSLRSLGSRSGPFSNISKGDSLQMKSLLDTIVREPIVFSKLSMCTESPSEMFENGPDSNSNMEEPIIVCGDSTLNIMFVFAIVSQIIDVFFSSCINHKFMESNECKNFYFYADCLKDFNKFTRKKTPDEISSDAFFIKKVKILTEKKLLQDLAVTKSIRLKEKKLRKNELKENFNFYANCINLNKAIQTK